MEHGAVNRADMKFFGRLDFGDKLRKVRSSISDSLSQHIKHIKSMPRTVHSIGSWTQFAAGADLQLLSNPAALGVY